MAAFLKGMASNTAPKFSIHAGDVLAVLKTFPDAHFDACLADPPYGLSQHSQKDIAECLAAWLSGTVYKPKKKGFMGKAWDGFVPGPEVWRELYRVLKPGAYSLIFAGSRTQDLMGLALRLAGFELVDCLQYMHGQGFPKSHNLSKALDKAAGAKREVLSRKLTKSGGMARVMRTNAAQGYRPKDYYPDGNVLEITAPATDAAKLWEGYGTQLKPAYEPCILVQKPLDGTYAQNAQKWGCGGLNIDGSRVETTEAGGRPLREVHALRDDVEYAGNSIAGRLDGSLQSSKAVGETNLGRFPANLIHDGSPEVLELFPGEGEKSAARFFYCAKVSANERNAGLAGFVPATRAGTRPDSSDPTGKFPDHDHRAGALNPHPTLKPLSLTEYFAKLLLVPPRQDGEPRRIITPFSGVGSEMIGSLLAGWDESTGIELDQEYVKIAEARIRHWLAERSKKAA